jgi:hypothetical protein
MRRNAQMAICGVMVVLVGSGVGAGQVRRTPSQPEKTGTSMQVSMMAGGQRYDARAGGVDLWCRLGALDGPAV